MEHTLSYEKILSALSSENLLIKQNLSNLADSVTYISHDSRDIKAKTLFFCKGAHFEVKYLESAISAGATCYLSEVAYENAGADSIIVKDIRLAIALIAPLFYDYPYKALELTGITGTKGKTTVAYFLRHIIDEFTGGQQGFLSTEETYTGLRDTESHNTTPEPVDLQRFFDEMRESKLSYCTMEVTSQAYKVDRVRGIDFDNAMFLNISEDHISPAEHPDFEDYFSCKLQLMHHGKNIIINRDMDHFARVLENAKSSEMTEKITTYGATTEADYYYHSVSREGAVQKFRVSSSDGSYDQEFEITTLGLFNVENATAAITLAKTLNIDDESIRKGLFMTQIPGRMNILEKNGITVVVDYAHNLLSFTKLYEAIHHDYPESRLIAVGGGPGGKALKRRQDFADVWGKYASHIILTAEDPQFEDPTDIAKEIASFMPDADYEIIPDREEAVKAAISAAKAGDVIILLAKGTEEFQKVRGNWEPYASDLTIAKLSLEDK